MRTIRVPLAPSAVTVSDTSVSLQRFAAGAVKKKKNVGGWSTPRVCVCGV